MAKSQLEVKDECNNVVKMLDLQHRKEVCGIQTIFNQMASGDADKSRRTRPEPNNNVGQVEKDAGSETIHWRWTDPFTREIHEGSRGIHCRPDIIRQRENLPIFHYKEHFINAVVNNQVVVVVGETGSGKSTQMPQYLLEAGAVLGRVAVTQPRRVAAVSVAQRVADELSCPPGDLVGYSIRFEDVSGPSTMIKYMTDGILLMECLRDPLFSPYSCIILDEAHERTLHTDVLLGLIKKALRRRLDLKVIVTSATLDIQKFADYFDAPMVKIPGKMFAVETRYRPRQGGKCSLASAINLPDVYIENAVDVVLEIHRDAPATDGDILVFLPGKEEVETACSLIASRNRQKNLIPVPIYAALPFESQSAIFQSAPPGCRKVVVATNIAETSLTIDGILYVVDTGYFKENVHDRGIDTLKVRTISRAQAEQRKGRAGRTAPGVCYRLYTEEDFYRMIPVPSPAIHRNDLTSTTLQLKSMGIEDICGFGFMDPPKADRVRYSLHRLRDLGALAGAGFEVTDLGRKMAEFPLAPHLAKILITASEMECSEEVLTIVSLLSVKYVFCRPRSLQHEADRRKKQFDDPQGDHLTLLNVFQEWLDNGKSEAWAGENFVNQKVLERANDIREQLRNLMIVLRIPLVSAAPNQRSNICRALAAGSLNNVARRDDLSRSPNVYKTLHNEKTVFIHPSSSLRSTRPGLVLFHETINTTKTYIRTVSECQRSWIPHLDYRDRQG